MKLTADVNEAVLSNVGTVGEFRIRNSAKAFNILSSGLYSNKIRAVIRELSCNAVDSHVAAGKANIPFEVHLPTILEPWFAVRDFGLGLDNDQVVNIYTTYFESTKTESNEFIGALGLGSKSPFSYTENFTVTAIKNGTKRIYSAFINENGVPSIAEMSTELSDEGNGVEVKFSVTNKQDYHTFRQEAVSVYKWFTLLPVVTGNSIVFEKTVYKEMNVVSGVHIMPEDTYNRYSQNCLALMGNISYPLSDIPQAEKHFGPLAEFLNCGLLFEFAIGELDFAASREVLSYIPQTIASIKKKLELLNDNLSKHLTDKVDSLSHPWEKSVYLYSEYHTRLYKNAVLKYINDTKFELFDSKSYNLMHLELHTKTLADRNLSAVGLDVKNGTGCRFSKQYKYDNKGERTEIFSVPVSLETIIVLNDLKTGCYARVRYHYVRQRDVRQTVIILSHPDPDLTVRQVQYDEILKLLHNPPVVVKASALEKAPTAARVATHGISYMRIKAHCYSGSEAAYMWDAMTTKTMDEKETYYYVGLNGNKSLDEAGLEFNFNRIKAWIDKSGIESLQSITIYGVRKTALVEILELDNWVRVEDKLREEILKITDEQIAALVITEMLDSYQNRIYTNAAVAKRVDAQSDYAKYYNTYGKLKRSIGSVQELVALCKEFGKVVEVDKIQKNIIAVRQEIYNKYPLLKHCNNADDDEVVEYIKMVDKMEKT
jgi:hypothetical protein